MQSAQRVMACPIAELQMLSALCHALPRSYCIRRAALHALTWDFVIMGPGAGPVQAAAVAGAIFRVKESLQQAQAQTLREISAETKLVLADCSAGPDKLDLAFRRK